MHSYKAAAVVTQIEEYAIQEFFSFFFILLNISDM